MRREVEWDTKPEFDTVGTLAHELGHVMGLPHIARSVGPALMNQAGIDNAPTWLDKLFLLTSGVSPR